MVTLDLDLTQTGLDEGRMDPNDVSNLLDEVRRLRAERSEGDQARAELAFLDRWLGELRPEVSAIDLARRLVPDRAKNADAASLFDALRTVLHDRDDEAKKLALRALLAERERAATIAYEIGEEFDKGTEERNVARIISAAIRLVKDDEQAPPPATILEARANIDAAVKRERDACADIVRQMRDAREVGTEEHDALGTAFHYIRARR